MLSLVLFLIIVYIVLGVLGFVVKGLFWLFIVAAVLFIITILASFFRAGSRHARASVSREKNDNEQ